MEEEQAIGSSYRHFVESQESEKGLLVENLVIDLDLSKDFKTLKHTYEYQIRATDDETHNSWYRLIPEPIESIKNTNTRGPTGNLESKIIPEDDKISMSKLLVQLPNPITKKDIQTTHITISYETPAHALFLNQLFSRIIVFSYWYIPVTKVKRLFLELSLPPNSKVVKASPAMEENLPIVFEKVNIQQKDFSNIYLIIRASRLGYAFWKGAFLSLTPTVIGAFVTVLIGKNINFLIPGILAGVWVISGIIYFIYHKLLS